MRCLAEWQSLVRNPEATTLDKVGVKLLLVRTKSLHPSHCWVWSPCRALRAEQAHLQDVARKAPKPRLYLSQLHFQKRAAQGVSQQQAGVPSPDHHIQALLLQRPGKVGYKMHKGDVSADSKL